MRAPGDTVKRLIADTQWPLAQTRWTRFYLAATDLSIGTHPPRSAADATYAAISAGVTFSTAPLAHEVEIAGPIKVRLWVSSSTGDMDIFATLRAFDPQGKELSFFSATEPKSPVAQGWLRASQRRLDPVRSTEYRPYHRHDEAEPLRPREVYPVDIEIWPASLALPAGYRLALTVQGKDFERADAPGPQKGSGWFLHDDSVDRPAKKFTGTNAVHTGESHESYLLLPVIPTSGA